MPLTFTCENSRQVNGAFDDKPVKQFFSMETPRKFKSLYISNNYNQNYSLISKGDWVENIDGRTFKINLKRIIDKLSLETHFEISPWISLKLSSSGTRFIASPLLKSKVKGNGHSYPFFKVFHYDKTTPIHESLGLPKNAHYVKSGPYYIEYNKNYGMINRVARIIKSAYLYDSVVCVKSKSQKWQIPSVDKNKVEDISFDFDKWPKSLNTLKKSIAQIVFDAHLIGSSEIKKSSFFSLFKAVPLSDLTVESIVDFNSISKKRVKDLLTQSKESRSSNSGEGNLGRYLSLDMIKGKILITLPLDKSKLANERNSYNPNKNLKLDLISHVSLSQVSKDTYYFYFHSNGNKNHNIEVGPIDFKKMYWRDSKIKYNHCTELLMKHLNEYERKAFVFDKVKNTQVEKYEELLDYASYRKYPLEQFIVTNNCRSIGSFEYEWPGIVKGYFQIPSAIMRSIYDSMSDSLIKWSDTKTEDRFTKFYEKEFGDLISNSPSIKDFIVSKWSKYSEDYYRWISLGNFDDALKNCKDQDIISNLKIQNNLKREKISFEFDKGYIDFSEYLGETKKKSSYVGEGEAISYVKTPCNDKEAKIKPPYGFRPPRNNITITGKEYWMKKTCEWVPHRYGYFSELTQYKVGLSKFEVDGVYVGKSRETRKYDLGAYDKTLLKRDDLRQEFNFDNIYKLSTVEATYSDDFLNLEFSSKDKKMNLIIGNIPLKKLSNEENKERYYSYTRPWAEDNFRGIYSLVGINPFPLASFYDSIKASERPLFSFFYDNEGKILNHHQRDIGIEQWYIRKKGNKFVIDLLSHERITPVARILIDLKLE